MRIVHVGSQSAFVDFLVGYFERAAPGRNTVVRLPSATTASGAAGAALGYGRHLAEVVRAARGADVLVAHMMTLPTALAMTSARRDAFVVWSGWGGDYYGRGAADGTDLLGPATRTLTHELGLDRSPRGGHPVRALIAWLVDRAVRRADAFSAPIPDDVDVMRASYPGFRGSYHQLNYADVSSFASQAGGPSGSDILLGNSASIANNHLEALEWLAGFDLTGRRVFVPLAYGDPAYREAVVARGTTLLGDAFDPLLEPMPLDAYVERVNRCSTVVMNHHRQQGLGNVGIGLWSGAHVHLSHRNPLHAFLERHGLDVQSLDSTDSLPSAPVTGEALEERRRVLRGIWGEEVVLANVQRLLQAAASR